EPLLRPHPGAAAPDDHQSRLRQHGDRQRAHRAGRDARHLHRERGGVGPALDGGPGPRLADGGVRDAPRVDGPAQAARQHQGARRRSDRRDPAPHRSQPARDRRSQGARGAHGLDRLRRPHRRRRHAVRVDHRRVRGAGAGDQARAGGGQAEEGSTDRDACGGQLRRRRRRPAARPRLLRGQPRRRRRQRRHDRRRRPGRGPGDRGAHPAAEGAPRRAPRAGGYGDRRPEGRAGRSGGGM
ncbi:MAG: Ribonuclease PH, partial [uncultured Solirubrobacteraceae bacterium]